MLGYSVGDVVRGLRDPALILGEIRELGERFNVAYHRRFRHPGNTHVMTEDWDALVLLDGCRYDLFAERNTLAGRLESRRSAGSHSWEFMQANFADQTFHDTVYVTANPHVHWLSDDVFHAIVNCIDDHWDEDLETVPPAAMTEVATQAAAEYPNKRLLVHYMQPHYPFVGETGQTFAQGGLGTTPTETPGEALDVWTQLRRGRVDLETVRRAYEENFDIAIESVSDLLPALDGRVVVSSDHGNLLGERMFPIPVRGFSHPEGLYVDELLTVPWLVREADGERPEHTTEEPEPRAEVEADVVADRLSDLGYTE
jgi:hypothetical protein